jgi:hypothetical protein
VKKNCHSTFFDNKCKIRNNIFMNQSRYIAHVFSSTPQLAVRSGNTNNDTSNENRTYALDEITQLHARSYRDYSNTPGNSQVQAPKIADIRTQFERRLDKYKGILVWVEDTQPVEGTEHSRAVAYAEIQGDGGGNNWGELVTVYAIPGDENKQLLNTLMDEVVQSSREGGYRTIGAFKNSMPEGLLGRYGFTVAEGGSKEDPLFELDLTRVGGEREQGNPPAGIPSSGNI